ncbi:hypothetical protein ACO1PK_10275 [Alishewanella sp. d11]|uniref:hypothetical protein n=1 Tax=Alishewanella sp. d11 TaxID=3414030 RepID=UPI003BF80CEE
MKPSLALSVMAMVMLIGCQASSAAEPAVLIKVDKAIKQQIERFVIDIVGGTQVSLADNVLTEQSELFIEQRMPLDAQGRPLDGRHSLPSYRFTLVKVQGHCVLQHPGSGKSVQLTNTTCRAVTSNH